MREEKRSEIIQDALEFLDDDVIEDVERLRLESLEIRSVKKMFAWNRMAALAACFLLIFFLGGTWLGKLEDGPQNESTNMEEDMDINLENNGLGTGEKPLPENDPVESTTEGIEVEDESVLEEDVKTESESETASENE